MRAVRRALAAVLGVTGVTGLILCALGVVGCWLAYAEAGRRADRTFGRAEASLGDVRDGLRQVRDRLRLTRGEVDALREREANPPAEPGLRRAAARRVAEGVSPQLAEARQKLVQATAAALVLEGVLDALAELPLGERVGIETDRLRDASDRLGELIGRAAKLAATLPGASPDPAGGASDEPSRLCAALDTVIAATDTGADRADAARERVRAWHARLLDRLTVAAIVATVLLGWIGLGQASLLVHGYVGVRRTVGGEPPKAERAHR